MTTLLLVSLFTAHSRFGRAGEMLAEAELAHRIAIELDHPLYRELTLGIVAGALLYLNRHDEALPRYQEGLELCRASGDQLGQANALNNIAQVEQALGRRETAAEHQRQAMELFRAVGYQGYYVLAVNNLAELSAELGRLSDARRYATEALESAAIHGMVLQEAFARQNLGSVHLAEGDLVAARAEWLRSLDLYEQVGSPRSAGVQAQLAELTLVVSNS